MAPCLKHMTVAALLALASPATAAENAAPHPSGPPLSTGFKFTEDNGADLYTAVCQGCHMPDGKGAIGAGAYPPLAGDPNLAAAGNPVSVVVNGLRAMPPVGFMMSDEQVAAVVNYVRTHFGNNYPDAVKPEDVKVLRH
ncbi:MAG: cytochrome c [Xanthobacteraceae bacterium]|nr:cytochrome c [Xanthobacteraceae bacterium]